MIRILLVEEQKVIREGLKVLLESEQDFDVAATVSNAYAAISKIEDIDPDILFISIDISVVDELDIIEIISQKYPDVKIIVFCDEINEQQLIRLLESEVKGYLVKNISMDEIKEAVRYVHKGYIHIGNKIFETVVPQLSEAISALTVQNSQQSLDRETEVILTEEAQSREITPWQTHSRKNRSLRDYNTILPNYQNGASPTQNAEILTSDSPLSLPPEPQEQPPSKKEGSRWISWLGWGILGLAAVSIGILSVAPTKTENLVIPNGRINGKKIVIYSPVEGRVKELTYTLGSQVQADRVLAVIESLGEDSQNFTSGLREQIQLKQQQLNIAQQSLNLLETNLRNKSSPQRQISQTNNNFDLERIQNQIRLQETALKKAQIQLESARVDYDRLLQQQKTGSVSNTELNYARKIWDLAKLEREQIELDLESLQQQSSFEKQKAIQNQQQENDNRQGLASEITALQQQKETQVNFITLLKKELDTLEKKLSAIDSNSLEIQQIEVKTPISGVIYATDVAESEIVSTSQTIASVLDCNSLWAEAIISPEVASEIDRQQTVIVKVGDAEEYIEGELRFIENLGEGKKALMNAENPNSSALPPLIFSDLMKKNFSRIGVSVNFPSSVLENQKNCRLGQAANIYFTQEEKSLLKKLTNWQK